MERQAHRLSDYDGNIVRLTYERLAHILAHPERVVQSPSDAAVRLYYRRYPATQVGEKLLCVVVKVAEEDAFIITAYLTDVVKRGRVLWERNR